MRQLNISIAGYGIVGQRRRGCIDRHAKMDVDGIEDLILKGGLSVLDSVSEVLVEINDDFTVQERDY